jgi:fused signal recognition particle receptor
MTEEKSSKGGFFRRLFRKDKQEEQPSPQAPEAVEPAPIPEPEPEPQVAEVEHAAELVKLKSGLKKTRRGFLGGLDEVFLGKKELDDQVVARLEEVLIRADIGVKTAYELLESVTDRVKRRELDDPEAVVGHLKNLITDMLSEVEAPLRVGYGIQPFVVMVIGVNGSGKTTTIAKIAARHAAAGRKVMVVAGDTFRAAAVEQLQIWADRVGCAIVRGKEKADPSSVAFEAIETALAKDIELVLVDTAGRLHTRVPLMEELKKVKRTLGKKIDGSPHETLLVIDASMGQNAILQARTFNEAIPITGVALTKLDGTAKGGVVVGMSNELKIPIRFVGVGEQMDDLREFNARDFSEALFSGADLDEE